ncbi:MAG TPA: hypothetical protein PKW98_09920 [Candidatus Wallbacteria bacterium]|nr:MAG: hypothetical protein BWY32_01651 [bacterium ADurb.Bin243]HOD39668.1 hypothetical protein [Candidatus Wallbacteria bacterium]HPG58123.1 hypothetical protein [Candidatus Wallbacteria bacterium]
MKIFKVIVALKTPSEKGLNADFRKRSKDIFDAADFFNNKFARWNKRIFITDIDNSKIYMLLIKEAGADAAVISPLEIGVFSRFLYHDRKWAEFSSEQSKLFKSVMFNEIDAAEALHIVDESPIEKGDREGVTELLKTAETHAAPAPQADSAERSVEAGEETASGFSSGRQTQISDELAVKTFQFLLDTQYIGKSSPEKRRAVNNIKSILTEWLEK